MSQPADDAIVIAAYARTPIGGFQGALANVKATQLGSTAVSAAVERAAMDPQVIDEIIMGNVLSAGLGQAPARQAALGAGLPLHVQATTLNKMCGSGMQAVIVAHDRIKAGSAQIIVAGGMESMTGAPYLMAKHRGGARMGHDTISDSMFLDGLEDAYDTGKLMGVFADEAARQYQFTRQAQDAFALQSLERAKTAVESGAFAPEIVPVTVTDRKGVTTLVDRDEQPQTAEPAKIPTLKPAFGKDGTVTAANASSISDGAAALIITTAAVARARGLPIVAEIMSHAAHAQEPSRFTSAPVPAMQKALDRAGWSADDIDLFEVNEAFAVVAMIARQELSIPEDRLNVNGGACALGHPIGASGARILATLISALEARGLEKGLACLCIGGGEATAMAIRLVS
jgi:acetyl-CoA C-acetyltransferase